MSFVKTLAACCIIATSFATAVFAEDAQDVVEGPGKAPVRGEKSGACVRTKWDSATDVCAPAAPVVEHVAVPPPAPAPEPVTRLAREELTIYFAFNKALLTEESKGKLDQISDAVNASPHVVKVNIVGYTDQIGSDSYNEKLSVKRAEAVKSYLDTKTRIPANVVGLRGLGKADPVTTGCGKLKKRKAQIACMAKNRRTEIEFEFQK